MSLLPLFHQLSGKRCLIVGKGAIALSRAQQLTRAEVIVDVISIGVPEELKVLVRNAGGSVISEAYTSEMLTTEYKLVICATDNKALNKQIGKDAQSKRILTDIIDDPRASDVIFPSIVDRDPVMVAVSSGGVSPVLSRTLKNRIEGIIPKSYGELAQLVGSVRQQVRAAISNKKERTEFWEQVLHGAVAEAVFSGKGNDAKQLLSDSLDQFKPSARSGEIYLIGAGPGDPELLTLRAFRLLQQCDVVLYDALVSKEVIDLISDDAELIYVGKRRANHALPQGGINQLLIDHAKAGRRVARLKGGDPFVFGRGGEEIQEIAGQNIPFQVIPGITAASGCASYAGIPLTHRDYAQSVKFVTGQLKDGSVDLNWSELIEANQTVVFYMGLKGLPVIAAELIAHGRPSDTPIALIEKGTTPQQRVITATLETIVDIVEKENVGAPTLIIVGGVVELHKTLYRE